MTQHPTRPRRFSARRRSLVAAALIGAVGATGLAQAQTYPDRSVRLIVGFPPGTAPDVVARLVGQKLGENLKQPIVIDNRAGAGGQIAAQAVAKSPPDGYNLLLGEVGSISIAPPAFSKLPYDPAKELAIVSEVARADFLLVVPVNSPVKTVAEFIKAAQSRSDRTNFATFGAGTPGHFGAEMFAEAGRFKIEPIHYRSTGDAVTAIVAGDVQGAFVTTALGSAQVKGGKVRALATTAQQRSPLLPDVPTFAELGMPKIDFSAWLAFFVPAGTPAPVLDTLNRQIVAATRTPEVRQKLEEAGFSVLGTSRADAEKMVRSEATRWAAVVKATGFKGE
ncbi:Bug family tripartite tricarboxylate transporter substrate binding protein [Piscinibacter koreensis]|uniref:Tripartite tricarboxylate transporter substrate binding protein n=1 Tax=Piscinibacter koreensis TaxID=2742824 RepID=A0A7Y6TXG3_9BURK|nr:tripartite tricarboxylate transporter substrate-binding protein [Schlegelella koreensis]NUZ07025.1 tripartite tricarboxylate transporter substrate binding protein [Schlegelella koreensis]